MAAKHKEAIDKLTNNVEELQSQLAQAELSCQEAQEELEEATTNRKLLEVLLVWCTICNIGMLGFLPVKCLNQA